MTNREYDLAKLSQSLDDLVPESATGIIKMLWPKIKEKRDQGIKQIEIYRALNNAGLRMQLSTFNNLIAKLVNEELKRDQTLKAVESAQSNAPNEDDEAILTMEEEQKSNDRPISPIDAIGELNQDEASLEKYKRAGKRKFIS